ncbi:MAG: aminodeoxychorismate synthase component I [Verrucomicrobiales bacterium]|nr:aminodeoxychorismate synthase component I [Verrucomicrobiales bacterium]
MLSLVETIATSHTPESLMASLPFGDGRVLLRTGCFDLPHARYSLVTAEPFLRFRAYGSRCELRREHGPIEVQYGNPWRFMESLLARFELLDELDLPFPLGGAFGYWGYDLRCFIESRLRLRAPDPEPLPDAWVGFHDSLVVFDHLGSQAHIVATGVCPDGSRDLANARRAVERWRRRLSMGEPSVTKPEDRRRVGTRRDGRLPANVESSFGGEAFCAAVRKAQRYIRAGDIYQVNLAQRLQATVDTDPWDFWQQLAITSPAPFAAYFDAGDFQIASVSPELFLRFSGDAVVTRPIKGTRPRHTDPTLDAQLSYELQTSPKEHAELLMITDLLRNDLGRVCDYGSVQVPDLMRLERYAQVQHLVSTVQGRLRPGLTHLAALEACFPGGSITGAPKIRAMEIIDELEPVARGPYTGCAGYLGFNRESQLSILIRTAVLRDGCAQFQAGAGIVADSDPTAEYEETLAKARAFLEVVERCQSAAAHSAAPPNSHSPRA